MNKSIDTNSKKLFLLFYILFFVFQNANAQQPLQLGTLNVIVSDFKSNVGQVLVQLFSKTDKVPTAPFKILKSEIVSNIASINFEELPFGDYGIIVVHDLNSNGMIDHEWGFPSEPLGYSNNWKLSLISGMPSFSKLKFSFNKNGQNYPIKIP